MSSAAQSDMTQEPSNRDLSIYDQRREALWSLLGDLPWRHEAAPPRVISTEQHETYRLERLLMDLNGVEPVPAILLIPNQLQQRASGLLFIHWHGGMYELSKEQLLRGTSLQAAYASVCAELGLVRLAIDGWCFGERKHDANGHRGEEDAFKLMLRQRQTLWGMMMFDEFRALTYLASRPEVDASRLGAFGMSMGRRRRGGLQHSIRAARCALDTSASARGGQSGRSVRIHYCAEGAS